MENMCSNIFLVNMGADLGVIIRREDGIYIQKRTINNCLNGGNDLPYNYLSGLHDVSCLEDCFVFCMDNGEDFYRFFPNACTNI